MPNSIPIKCPRCGVSLGLTVIQTNQGTIRLFDGKMTIEAGETHCPCCGRIFHWRSRDYSTLPEVARQLGPAVEVGV